uniref:Methyltransferase-like protein n=1 Tax=Oryza rufipogon TaxID=4529 RepID=A0A0E0Q757_ORYRU
MVSNGRTRLLFRFFPLGPARYRPTTEVKPPSAADDEKIDIVPSSKPCLRVSTMEGGGERAAEAEEYHCHDFEWEDLRAEVEANPAFSYHLSPFPTTVGAPEKPPPPPPPSEAWTSFHRRHTSGNSSPSTTVYACDCSKETLEKANEIVCSTKGVEVKDRFHPFLLDASNAAFPDWLFCKSCRSPCSSNCNMIEEYPAFLRDNPCCVGGVDFITMIFTLSAIPFDNMLATLERCVSVLKPGGLVLFRDYGLYDMTMLRFLPHQRVGFREYMRSDGTLSYFFTLDTVRELFHASGLLELELEYCCVISVNRKKGKKMQRVWVHGKFQKP